MDRVRIKAGDGARLRDEKGVLVPEEGRMVTMSSYWTRRIADGDAIVTTSVVPIPTKKKKNKSTSKDSAKTEAPKHEVVI